MSYLKFSATALFTGEVWLGPESVLITNKSGEVVSICDREDAGSDIREEKGILSPGFVNAHLHLELSHLKGRIPKETGMTRFLLSVVGERGETSEKIAAAISEAEDEMLSNGIVAAGDICNTTDTLAQKQKGRIQYHNFVESFGFLPQVADQRFAQSFEVYRQFHALWPQQTSLVPHAPYSVSPRLLDQILAVPGNALLCMHSQESEDERQFMAHKQGPMLQLYERMNADLSFFQPAGGTGHENILPRLSSRQSMMLVHNVTTRKEDMEQFAQWIPGRLSFCICPGANLYIGNGLPDLPLLLGGKYPVGIGTDSLASNDGLNILEEIRILRTHFPQVPLLALFSAATLQGARLLGMESFLGSFEKGKKPGVLLCQEDLSAVTRLV